MMKLQTRRRWAITMTFLSGVLAFLSIIYFVNGPVERAVELMLFIGFFGTGWIVSYFWYWVFVLRHRK